MEQQIIDIAALVFWRNAKTQTFNVTRNTILKRNFEEIWTKEIIASLLLDLNLTVEQSHIDSSYQWIYEQVNEFLYNATLTEQNIIGTVYLNDTIECRSPNFNDFDLLQNLQEIYINKEVNKSNLQNIGTLLLRTPLPSVVFTNETEIPKSFNINDTTNALGFQAELQFDTEELIEFPPNSHGIKYCISGTFKIANYKGSNVYWQKLLPNSICYEDLIFLNLENNSLCFKQEIRT